MQMRHFAITAGAIWLLAISGAHAQSKPVVVVELYTSQGCSSCPPADAFMTELVANPDVIALALHVDYWDYIGWKDEFAHAAFTDRQKDYARAVGSRTIYTPQMIVNGTDRVEGVNPEAVESLVRMHLEMGSDVSLALQRDGDRLVVRGTRPPSGGALTVNLVRYMPSETVNIERGENAGMTVTYHNVVTELSQLGEWTGDGPLEIEAAVTGNDPVAVFVQEAGPGKILTAARLD